MVKRKTQPLIDSDSSSDSEAGTDLESELLSLSKRKKTTRLASASPNHNSNNNRSGSESESDSEDDDEDDEDDESEPEDVGKGRKKSSGKPTSSSEEESDADDDGDDDGGPDPIPDEKAKKQVPAAVGAAVPPKGTKRKHIEEEDEEKSEPEEGQVSSDSDSAGEGGDSDDDDDDDDSTSDSSSSSSDSEFNDGFDENLMGDDEDRARLNALSEKERETEIFKRIERRDVMKTRWEIERKLKLAKRAERAKDKQSQPEQKKRKKEKKRQKKAAAAEKEKKKKAAAAAAAAAATAAAAAATAAASAAATAKLPSPTVAPAESPKRNLTESEPAPQEERSASPSSSPEKRGDDASSASEYFDPKERSKERKKTVEMNRTDDKRSNAMALLKAKREGKAKREEEEAKREAQRKQDTNQEEKEDLEDVPGGKSQTKLKASDIYSDDSGDSDDEKKSDRRSRSGSGSGSSSGSGSESRSTSDSEGEDREKKSSASGSSSSSSRKPVAISSNEELNKLRISRYKLERFINLPIFDTTVLNCFVRINIGNNNGRPVYRVAEIVGVVETAKIYQFGRNRTNKGFKLKHGSQERVFRLEFISNQDFSDTEYQKWLTVCETTGTPLPTVDMIEKKQRDIKDAVHYQFNDADINQLVEQKNRFRAHPTNYAMKKTCLMKERDAAQLRGEDEIARDLSTQIQEIEERASTLDKRRSSSISLISYINDRNRKRNVEDAEKAILEEKRATRGLKIEDPFTRRQTQPRMSFKKDEKRDEPQLLPMLAPPPPGKKKQEDKKPTSQFDNNLYLLHDFEIDLNVDLPVNSVNVLPKPVEKPVKESGPKRSLNLEDYKKKRGLI